MSEQEKEIKNDLNWKLKCRDCEANIGANGLKSIPLAEEFMTKHAAEMGHTNFTMDVYGFTLIIKNITDETAVEPCGKN